MVVPHWFFRLGLVSVKICEWSWGVLFYSFFPFFDVAVEWCSGVMVVFLVIVVWGVSEMDVLGALLHVHLF